MKLTLKISLLLFLFLNCSKKMEPVVSTESSAPAAPKVNQQLAQALRQMFLVDMRV